MAHTRRILEVWSWYKVCKAGRSMYQVGDELKCQSSYFPDFSAGKSYIVVEIQKRSVFLRDDLSVLREIDFLTAQKFFGKTGNIFDADLRDLHEAFDLDLSPANLQCTCGCASVGSSAHREYCDLISGIAS